MTKHQMRNSRGEEKNFMFFRNWNANNTNDDQSNIEMQYTLLSAKNPTNQIEKEYLSLNNSDRELLITIQEPNIDRLSHVPTDIVKRVIAPFLEISDIKQLALTSHHFYKMKYQMFGDSIFQKNIFYAWKKLDNDYRNQQSRTNAKRLRVGFSTIYLMGIIGCSVSIPIINYLWHKYDRLDDLREIFLNPPCVGNTLYRDSYDYENYCNRYVIQNRCKWIQPPCDSIVPFCSDALNQIFETQCMTFSLEVSITTMLLFYSICFLLPIFIHNFINPPSIFSRSKLKSPSVMGDLFVCYEKETIKKEFNNLPLHISELPLNQQSFDQQKITDIKSELGLFAIKKRQSGEQGKAFILLEEKPNRHRTSCSGRCVIL